MKAEAVEPASGRRRASEKLRALLPQQAAVIVRNASSLILTMGVTSGLGVVYWAVAARSFSVQTVGFASASISAMTLIATLGSLGLGTMLMGEIPRREGDAGRLVRATLLIAGVLTVSLGVVGGLLAPLLSRDLGPLSSHPTHLALFALGSVVIAVGLVVDQALIGFLRGGTQLARNVVFGLAKLGLLAGVAVLGLGTSGVTMLGTWVVGAVLSLGVAFAAAPLRARSRPSSAHQRVSGRTLFSQIARSAAGHQVLNLGLKVPQLLVPVLVVATLSVEANARFYIALMVTTFLGAVPGSLSNVLYTVGAEDRPALAAKLRFTLGLSAAMVVGLVLVVAVLATPLLNVFGEGYADASWTLRLLALSTVPLIVKTHYVAVARMQRKVRRATPVIWAGTMLEVIAVIVGARVGGLDGVALGWALAMSVEAIVMGPVIVRARRAH